MGSCRTQESKKKARRSINCMFLGLMMICEIEFVMVIVLSYSLRLKSQTGK